MAAHFVTEYKRCAVGSCYPPELASKRIGPSVRTLYNYRKRGLICSTPTGQYKGEELNRLWDLYINGKIC